MRRIAVPLVFRMRTRVGWLLFGAVCWSFTAASIWALLGGDLAPASIPMLSVIGGGYAWLAAAASRVGLARRAWVEIGDDVLEVVHDGLIEEAIIIARSNIVEASVDARPHADRRVAAARRKNAVASPSFLDPSIPVVSAAPSSHSRWGTAGVPNLVLRFAEPVAAPVVRRNVRLALRVSVGRMGRYRGPVAGRPMPGLRLVVADADAVARELHPVVVETPRDRRFLAAVDERDRTRVRRERYAYVAVAVAVVGILLALRAAA